MSRTNEFNADVKRGKEGVEKLVPYLKSSGVCWRQLDEGRHAGTAMPRQDGGIMWCTAQIDIESVEEDKAYQTLYDIDLLVHLNCKGCPLLKDEDSVVVTQWHEVKRSEETHGHDGRPAYQNIIVETVSSLKDYLTGRPTDDAWENPFTGEMERIRKGVGWWTKRDEVYNEDGNLISNSQNRRWQDRRCDWYHFLLEFDDNGHEEKRKREDIWRVEASDEAKKSFYNQHFGDNNAILLARWPIDACLSVTGRYLESILANYTAKNFNNATIYRIPLADILPAQRIRQVEGTQTQPIYNQLHPGKYYDRQNIKVNFIDDEAFLNCYEEYVDDTGLYKDLYVPTSLVKAIGFELSVPNQRITNFVTKDADGNTVGVGRIVESITNGTEYGYMIHTSKAKYNSEGRLERTDLAQVPTSQAYKSFESNNREGLEYPYHETIYLLATIGKNVHFIND